MFTWLLHGEHHRRKTDEARWVKHCMRRVVLIDFRPVFEVQTTFYIYSYDLSQLVMGRCYASATDFRRGKKSQQWGRCMPLPQTKWRFQSLALREDQPKTRESLCKSPIQFCGIFWDNHPAFFRVPAEHPKASPSFAAQGIAAQ